MRWLASDAPSSLNGETLKLDGGFSLTRKSRPAPSAEVAEWLVEPEWRAQLTVREAREVVERGGGGSRVRGSGRPRRGRLRRARRARR